MRLLITLGPKLEQQIVTSIGLARLSPHMGSEENDCIQNQIIHSEIQNKSTEDSEYMQVDYYHVDHTHLLQRTLPHWVIPVIPSAVPKHYSDWAPPPSCSYLITRAPLLPQMPKAYRMHSFTSAMSNFNYCSLVRNFSSSQSLNKIENLQKRA